MVLIQQWEIAPQLERVAGLRRAVVAHAAGQGVVDGVLAVNQFAVAASFAMDTNGYAWVGFGGRNGGVRCIGDVVVEAGAELGLDPPTLVGFENHSGRTYLGRDIRPLGRVLRGHGNNGRLGSTPVADENDPSWIRGVFFGSALRFDGDDFVQIPDSASLEPASITE